MILKLLESFCRKLLRDNKCVIHNYYPLSFCRHVGQFEDCCNVVASRNVKAKKKKKGEERRKMRNVSPYGPVVSRPRLTGTTVVIEVAAKADLGWW